MAFRLASDVANFCGGIIQDRIVRHLPDQQLPDPRVPVLPGLRATGGGHVPSAQNI
jgi:hypothetical protein